MYYAGLDLGQSNDFSALVILDDQGGTFVARDIRRWALGTRYTTIVDDLKTLYQDGRLADSILAVDGTGCGAPVVDSLFAADIRACMLPVLITAGHHESYDAQRGYYHVPKKTLVSTLQMLFGNNRLFIGTGLKLAKVLVAELQNFKYKISTDTAHESYGAWRDGENDDTVLAAACAAWAALKGELAMSMGQEAAGNRTEISQAPPGVFASNDGDERSRRRNVNGNWIEPTSIHNMQW